MILQINPSQALEVALTCGPLTYFLVAGIILATIATAAIWIAYQRKDKQIKKLGEKIVQIKEEDANRALLNLEVFNKLTDALDKILVDDRENAEAIKVLIKEIRSEIKSNKELFMMKLEHVEDLVGNEKA